MIPSALHLRRYVEPSRFPAVKRDLSLVAPRALTAARIGEAIRHAAGDLLARLVLFDVYEGEQVPAGTRSLAFALTFQSGDRTLADEEVDAIVARIVRTLADDLSVRLRG